MKWQAVLGLLHDEILFESAMLLAGDDPPREVRRQLSRWTAAGRILQLRRGLYAIAPPYAHETPHPFAVAARIRRPSYVSLESALAYRGMIPEAVPVVTSVTTGRPGTVETPLGVFRYRHVERSLFGGYESLRLGGGRQCFVASPEKALLDLFHLTPGPITEAFLRELRLEPSAGVDLERLRAEAERTRRPKLVRAAALAARTLAAEREAEAHP
jgi:hypothetical protein